MLGIGGQYRLRTKQQCGEKNGNEAVSYLHVGYHKEVGNADMTILEVEGSAPMTQGILTGTVDCPVDLNVWP